MTAGRLSRRLNRILVLLPYAIKHPGVTIDELSHKFDVGRQDLLDDLQLVFLCGLPGYGPGDLIDVELQDDRVFVRMADYFGAPLRLTPAEGLALLAGGEAIADLPGMEEADALRRGLAKLRRALGAGDDEGLAIQLEDAPQGHLNVLQNALTDGRRVRVEYRSSSRGELTERDVDPWGLVTANGRWYLVGLDHLSGEERMFRVDRIKSAAALEDAARVPEGFDPQRYKGAFLGHEGQAVVTLEISPQTSRWFAEYYPVKEQRRLDDGWHEVSLYTSGDLWAATLALRLGPHARNVRPETARAAAEDLAAGIAALYGDA